MSKSKILNLYKYQIAWSVDLSLVLQLISKDIFSPKPDRKFKTLRGWANKGFGISSIALFGLWESWHDSMCLALMSAAKQFRKMIATPPHPPPPLHSTASCQDWKACCDPKHITEGFCPDLNKLCQLVNKGHNIFLLKSTLEKLGGAKRDRTAWYYSKGLYWKIQVQANEFLFFKEMNLYTYIIQYTTISSFLRSADRRPWCCKSSPCNEA